MFVRNAWVHTRFLKGKGTLDTVKEDHSVTESESSLPPLAGSKKSSYMRSPLESPQVQCCWVGWRGPLSLKWTSIEGEGPVEVSLHDNKEIVASTLRNTEKDRWAVCCNISTIDR